MLSNEKDCIPPPGLRTDLNNSDSVSPYTAVIIMIIVPTFPFEVW